MTPALELSTDADHNAISRLVWGELDGQRQSFLKLRRTPNSVHSKMYCLYTRAGPNRRALRILKRKSSERAGVLIVVEGGVSELKLKQEGKEDWCKSKS